MTPTEAYKAGRLADAVAAAIEQVRNNPTDAGRRLFLADLLVFAGDLERADKQLDVLFKPDAPDLLPAVTLYRQLVRGETARREVFAHGRVPEFLTRPPENVRLQLESLIQLREGKTAEAAALLAKAEEVRAKPVGTCDGAAFDDLRDLDDRTAGVLEVVTANGNYYWVPFETIESLEFLPPERARDLYWRPTRLIVRDGPDGVVYVPALYPGTHAEADESLKLGRGTDYRGGDGSPYLGAGLREFLVGDEAKPVLAVTKIETKK